MTYEYGACAHTDFEGNAEQSDDKVQRVTWRRRAKSLCDVTWEPVCILKFLSQVGNNFVFFSIQTLIVSRMEVQKTQ